NGYELGVTLNFNASGHVSLLGASVSGSLLGNGALGFELADPNNDGRLRLNEIAQITDNFQHLEKLFQIFDLTGSGTLGITGNVTLAGVDVGSLDRQFQGGFSLLSLLNQAYANNQGVINSTRDRVVEDSRYLANFVQNLVVEVTNLAVADITRLLKDAGAEIG